jgi:hypothetical protein
VHVLVRRDGGQESAGENGLGEHLEVGKWFRWYMYNDLSCKDMLVMPDHENECKVKNEGGSKNRNECVQRKDWPVGLMK